MNCPKCGGPFVDMTGVGFNADQFRKEDGRCFAFSGSFECCTKGMRSAVLTPRIAVRVYGEAEKAESEQE